ncbi:MAG: lysine N(6)-hydroxylase/L-ornithine N(5)-oxygenase family protein [Oleispira sp.]
MSQNNEPLYDVIAIGLGPFNLSLACLTDNITDIKSLFLEQRSHFDWHPGMMLESAHLQTPFMSDLVTLADPTHPLSFLNYIKQQGRLYSFYIRESFYLMRKEYNQYCQWATRQVSNIRFNTHVNNVKYDSVNECYQVECIDSRNNDDKSVYYTKKLVLGTGPSPYIPKSCLALDNKVTHSSNYLKDKADLQKKKSITIVGSGQSAAEIYYDLLQEIDVHGYELNWITRSARFFPLEYSKLTLEMTSPEYVDYFYQLPADKKESLISQQKNLYKGINSSLINDIHELLYIKRLSHSFKTNLITNSTLVNATDHIGPEQEKQIKLDFHHDEQDKSFSIPSEGVVLATGYNYQLPEFLALITDRIQWDNLGRFDVNRNYSIDHNENEIFIQNAELHTHGFVSPDLGMACYRNSIIIKEVLGKAFYPIEERIAFQQFSVEDFSSNQLSQVVCCDHEVESNT